MRRLHPYSLQPERAFWKKTVANTYPLDIQDWYTKKFDISGATIATAGSCFAQHIGHQLKTLGFNYLDAEPAPSILTKSSHLDFGYGMYSARYGNIYTSRQLWQLLQRATGKFEPQESIWQLSNGLVDPFRPTIEPEPFESEKELNSSRDYHYACVRKILKSADVFVFTLGLTEAWESTLDGAVFPIAPGVSGGNYDPALHKLKRLEYTDVVSDLEKCIRLMRKLNHDIKFILTVSPVPLMATATDDNVIVATMLSKSILRAAAGHLANKYEFIDYFPSYEIISSHVMRSQFYEPDMRGVSLHGVKHVMSHFFKEHPPEAKPSARPIRSKVSNENVKCDEELLANFGGHQ